MKDLHAALTQDNSLRGDLSVPDRIGGDYPKLDNKPRINGEELIGDKSFEELGELTLTNSELKALIDSQFDLIFGGT